MTHWQEYVDTGRILLSLHEQICLLFQWDELNRKKTTQKKPQIAFMLVWLLPQCEHQSPVLIKSHDYAQLLGALMPF